MCLKRKQLPNSVLLGRPRDRIHNFAVYSIYMNRVNYVVEFVSTKTNKFFIKISCKAFCMMSFTSIYYNAMFAFANVEPYSKCVQMWVWMFFFLHWRNNRILLAVLPLPLTFTIHHQMWILGHCFRFSFTVAVALLFITLVFFSVHIVFEFSMWTTFANNAVFSLHYVETHANLISLFGSFLGLFLASLVFIH